MDRAARDAGAGPLTICQGIDMKPACISLMAALLLSPALSGPNGGARAQAAPPEPRKPPEVGAAGGASSAKGVSVQVDPRIELMTVIQLLADYPVLTSLASPYRADARAFFAAHAAHPAVTAFDTMSSAGFAFDAVPKAFASMSPLPDLRLGHDVPPEAIERAGGRPRLEAFAVSAAQFAHESDFAAFYRAHEGTYKALVDSALPHVHAAVGQLEAYLGADFAAARVVLSPLLHDGGFAMRGTEPASQAFIGPVGLANGFPDFGGEERLGPLIWHEFAHTIVNPLTHQAQGTVDSMEVVDATFRDTMRRQAYGDWETIVSESVIRALEVRLATRTLGSEAGARALARQVDRGFRHVPRLVEALREYESDRSTYPTLALFYLRLLRVFRKAARP